MGNFASGNTGLTASQRAEGRGTTKQEAGVIYAVTRKSCMIEQRYLKPRVKL